jgi:hypothetical protein
MPSDLTSSTGSGNHQPAHERRSQFGKDAPIAAIDTFTGVVWDATGAWELTGDWGRAIVKQPTLVLTLSL